MVLEPLPVVFGCLHVYALLNLMERCGPPECS